MNITIELRRMEQRHISEVQSLLAEAGIRKPEGYFENCLFENEQHKRYTLLGYVNGQFAGALHIRYESHYPPFSEQRIPEINDLNVLPKYRKQGVATRLIEESERIVAEQYDTIGIGFGLFKDYGNAQRLYGKLGYIPDGNGIYYNNQPVVPGSMVRVDDDLVLYLTKKLR
ncbi:GNAT family N-acetyltransferase [Paenibacillus sp. MBLB4367]|uniref:GNAT family N-acetyltransferase n=1 Tax=Paenibacillus sp. MBLB4367 TaxID=3384767 RepID=UPI003908111E